MLRPAFAIFAQHYLSALLSDFGTVYLNEPIPRDPKLRIFKHPSRFNWGTEYIRTMTAGNNRVIVSPEVISEAELVDVLFEPDKEKSMTSLGLLGKLVSNPCIIETLRWAPNIWELQTCLRHWLTWKAENSASIIPVYEDASVDDDAYIDDDDEEENGGLEEESDGLEEVNKTLVIIVPSITAQNLEKFGNNSSSINVPGIYELPPVFCTTLVVTNELPQDISTVWLRVLGRGNTQRRAIMELQSLDVNHPHRAVVREQLGQWHHLLSEGQMGREWKQLMETLAIVDGLN
jgi:hypothetical protein